MTERLLNSPFIRYPLRLLLLGPPGAGKGTFATRLSTIWNIPHVSTGNLLRDEIHKGSLLGLQCQTFTKQGQLVPNYLIDHITKNRLLQSDIISHGYILDGYPRTVEQAQFLSTYSEPHMCVYITMLDEHLIYRISGRRNCKDCGYNYNVVTIKDDVYDMPPLLPEQPNICDSCGKPLLLSLREDDAPDIVKTRLQVYRQFTEPVINFYECLNILLSFQVYKGIKDLPQLQTQILNKIKS